MNKLTIHVQKLYDDCERHILDLVTTYRFPFVKLMDDSVKIAGKIKEASPNTKIIYRHWFDNPQPHNDWQSVYNALMSDMQKYGVLQYVDFFEGTNEPVGNDQFLIDKLKADLLLAHHLPKPLLAAAFSTGWPDLHFWHYPTVQRILAQLRDAGAHLALHQYYCPQDPGSWQWQLTRHRMFLDALPHGMKIFITETGVDCGGQGKGWKTYMTPGQYVDFLRKAADEFAKDGVITMASVFTMCNAGWDTFETKNLDQNAIWGYQPKTHPNEFGAIDIVDQLPKRKPYYTTRDLKDIEFVVIHHSAVDKDVPIEQIAHYHVDYHKWPGIGYHFVINSDGKVHQTNRLTTRSYHAFSYGNTHGVGICLQGDFTHHQPTLEQLASAHELIEAINKKLNRKLAIYGHREVKGVPLHHTVCPGATWPLWKPYLEQKEEIPMGDKVKTIPVPENAKWPEIDGREILDRMGIKVIPPKCLAEDGYAWYPIGFVWNKSGNPNVEVTFQQPPEDAIQETSVFWMKHWPDAPHIEGVTDDMVGSCIPTLPYANAVYTQVPVPGSDSSWTMGHGEQIFPGQPNKIPTAHWPYSFKHPAAVIVGLGWEDNHYHPDPIYRLVKPIIGGSDDGNDNGSNDSNGGAGNNDGNGGDSGNWSGCCLAGRVVCRILQAIAGTTSTPK